MDDNMNDIYNEQKIKSAGCFFRGLATGVTVTLVVLIIALVLNILLNIQSARRCNAHPR